MATIKKVTKTNTKDERIYIRITSGIKEDFEAIAAYRGLKTSTLLHSMIVNLIHEEREKRPHIFDSLSKRENAKEQKSKTIKSKAKTKQSEQFITTRDGKKIQLIDEALAEDDQ